MSAQDAVGATREALTTVAAAVLRIRNEYGDTLGVRRLTSDVDRLAGLVRKGFFRKRAEQGEWDTARSAAFMEGNGLGVGLLAYWALGHGYAAVGLAMLVEFAAFESERIGDQWKEAHSRRVRNGLPATGKPRFGYRRAGEGFEPDPETGPLLAEMQQSTLRLGMK